MARAETTRLAYADLNHIAQGIHNVCLAQQQLLEQKVRSDLKVASNAFHRAGQVEFAKENVMWDTVNQFDKSLSRIELPRMMLDKTWLGQNYDLKTAPRLWWIMSRK